MIQLCFEHVTTNLDVSYLLSYLILASELNLENLKLEQIPGDSIYTNGVWIFKVDEEKTKALLDNVNF